MFINKPAHTTHMNLQGLSIVPTPKDVLDVAFSRASKAVSNERTKIKGDNLRRSKALELTRVSTVKVNVIRMLEKILYSFPQFNDLDPFYRELVKATIDYRQLKKSLGSVAWAIQKTRQFYRTYHAKIKTTKHVKSINPYRQVFYGRISSVLNQIKKELVFLEEVRKVLKNYPTIKTSMTTIVIAGFPNVGKTTILSALTGSTPKIASYPFTTQHIMLGYTTINKEKIQVLDTPGLLERIKKNNIEKQSVLALKYLAKAIIFVFDPSNTTQYTMKEQKKLLLHIKKTFNLPLIVVVNKADLPHETIKGAIEVSAKEKKGFMALRQAISNVS
jgi:nucleolar GTP-binding protein